MEYVLLKYRGQVERVVELASTDNPAEAVALARRWSHAAPEVGLIVTVGTRAIIHCTPRAA